MAPLGVFSKISALLHTSGVRVVSFQRRNYAGSTPITAAELAIIQGGTDGQKSAFFDDHNREILNFIDWFIQKHDLPPATSDSLAGGVAVLGWSFGAAYALGLAAALNNAPTALRDRFSRYLRGVLMLGQFICLQT
jgi:pimeloyl-ACP methyl ester carboxylesterase